MSVITYASFDEVPSLKGASYHILAGLRVPLKSQQIQLLSLGQTPLRFPGLTHTPIGISEPNLIKRGLLFRNRIRHILRRNGSSLIHFRSPWEGLAAIEAGVPTIYEVNGLPSVEAKYHYRTMSESVTAQFRAWELECLARATKIISPSEQTKRFLLGISPGLAAEKIEILPNGYDSVPCCFLQPSPPTPPPGVKLRLVYLGTLTEWQGIRVLLSALRQLGDPGIRLDIFAPQTKHFGRRIGRRIERLGLAEQVRLLPALDRGELTHTLPNYDAGVATFERTARNLDQGCYPLKLLDYLAHGLPVIASDLPVVRQVLTPDQNSLLFPAGSATSLAELLSAACEQPEQLNRLRQHATASLKRQWSWTEYGTRLSRLYAELR